MGRGVRTVQRYHATLHLPVHRIASGNKRSRVFAYREELDHWMRRHARPEIAARIDERLAATKERVNKVSAIQQRLRLWRRASEPSKELQGNFEQTRQLGFTFMSNDLDAALILAQMAEESRDARKRSRTEANARRVLDTVLNLYRRSKLTDDERSLLDGKIAKVRAALERIAPQQQSE